jgi:hypothetical protein
LTRYAFLPVAGCFVAYLWFAGNIARRERLRALIAAGIPIAVGMLIVGLVNWLKWGSPVDFGHHDPRETFSTNAFVGLYGLLLSPGKGIFIHAPMLLAVVFSCRAIWREGSRECLLVLVVTAVYLGIYSQWYDWWGGLCWGPRFLVPLIAPWLVLGARALRGPNRARAVRWFAGLAAVGFGIQFLGWAVYPHWIYMGPPPDPFSLTDSHIVATARVLAQRGIDDLWLLTFRFDSGEYLALAALLWGLLGIGLFGLWRGTIKA